MSRKKYHRAKPQEPVKFDPEKHALWKEPSPYSTRFTVLSVLFVVALTVVMLVNNG